MPNPFSSFISGAKDVAGAVGDAAGRWAKSLDYVLTGNKSELDPTLTDKSISDQAAQAKTPTQATDVLNNLLGPLTHDDQNLLWLLRTKDQFNRVITGVHNPEVPSYQPFTPQGSNSVATGAGPALDAASPPYTPIDQSIQNIFQANDRNMELYLRTTDPLKAMPALVEQKANRQSSSGPWYDKVLDIAGRPLGGLKELGKTLIYAPQRIETALGMAMYNDIPDAHLRYQMSQHWLDQRFRLSNTYSHSWFLSDREETMIKAAQGLSADPTLSAPQRQSQFATVMGENSLNGLTGIFHGFVLHAAFDPLMYVPPEWLLVPAKGASGLIYGTADLGKATRVLPLIGRGRELIPEYGTRGVVKLDEAAYQAGVLASPPKGVANFLTQFKPVGLANEATNRLMQFVAPKGIRLDLGEGSTFVADLEKSFATHTATGMIADIAPNLFTDPYLARAGALLGKNPTWLSTSIGRFLKGDLPSQLAAVTEADPAVQDAMRTMSERLGRPVTAAEAIDSTQQTIGKTVIRNSLYNAVLEGQKDLYANGPVAKFFLNRVQPVTSTLRQATAFVTLNNPGFDFLHFMSRGLRYAAEFGSHPLEGSRNAIDAMFTEATGRWPARMAQMFDHPLVGVDIADVERGALMRGSFQDVLGMRSTEPLADLPPGELMGKVQEALSAPANQALLGPTKKILGVPVDAFRGPLWLAGRIDSMWRRASYWQALTESLNSGLVPGFVAKSVLPDMTDQLVRVGVTAEQARAVQYGFVDELKRSILGQVPHEAGATHRDILQASLDRTLQKYEVGGLGSLPSPTGHAYDVWAHSKGYAGDAARYGVVTSLDRQVIPMVTDIMSGVTKDTPLADVTRQLSEVSQKFEDVNDIASEIAGQNPITLAPNTYRRSLRLTDRAIKADMTDNVLYMRRNLGTVWGDSFTSAPIIDPATGEATTPARMYNDASRGFTVDHYQRLQSVHDQAAQGAENGINAFRPGLGSGKRIGSKEFNKLLTKEIVDTGADPAPAIATVARRIAQSGGNLGKDSWSTLVNADRELALRGATAKGKQARAAIQEARNSLREAQMAIAHGPARPDWMPLREVTGVKHYSSVEREVLDPSRIGTGLGGQGLTEQEAATRPQFLSYYRRGAPEEKVIGSRGPMVRHDADVHAALADWSSYAKRMSGASPSDLEWAIKADGYDGYFNSALGGVDAGKVSMFYDVVPQKTDIVDQIIDATAKKGGTTITLSGATPKDGFAVGSFPERTVTVPAGQELTKTRLEQFIKDNRDFLSRPGYHVGTWVDPQGNTVLDISSLVKSQDEAVNFAAHRGQEAIWDVKNGKEIPIPAALRESFSGQDTGRMWADVWRMRREGALKFYNTSKLLAGDDATAAAKADEWYADLIKTYDAQEGSIRQAFAEGGDAAWRRAGNQISQSFKSAATRRSQLFSLPTNDPATAPFAMGDHSAPHSMDVSSYIDSYTSELTKAWPDFQTGKMLPVGDSAKGVLSAGVEQMTKDWPSFRQQVIGHALAKTDFVNLNYNNQYGIDSVMNMFAPFSYWPTRDAIHWAVRFGRNPAAFATVTQWMVAQQEMAKQYNLPGRVKWDIPMYLPGLDQFLQNIPVVGNLMRGMDLGPVYAIDPLRYLFPYKEFTKQLDVQRDQGTTPAGQILSWMENYTPLSAYPFAKIIGRETGLLDRSAWQATYFGGGPFGLPLTPMAQAAARWFYTGDNSAISPNEQGLYMSKGHFSNNLLSDIFGIDDSKWSTYKAERSLWTLAADDKLLPGQAHQDQVDAAWAALDSHAGPAWQAAVKDAQGQNFLQELTRWAGFPFGGMTGMDKGETMWLSLKQAYDQAAQKGQLDKFFTAYPEFQVRSAVVKGLTDPAVEQKAVDTELYYQDLEKIVNKPFQPQLDEIDQKLRDYRNLPQTEPVRQSIALLNAQVGSIRQQQADRRNLLEAAYPNRETELSLNHPPEDRALKQARSDFYKIQQNPGESYAEFQLRQAQELQKYTGSATQKDWDNVYSDYLLTRLSTGQAINDAYNKGDFPLVQQLKTENDTRLQAIHTEAQKMLSAQNVNDYLSLQKRPITQEEQDYKQADQLFQTWMTLVGSGSLLSSRQKGAISAYFDSLPLMQKYFASNVLNPRLLTPEQDYALSQRRAIWKKYYSISDPNLQLDYMHSVESQLLAANTALGLPSPTIVDYRRPPVEVRGDDPAMVNMEMNIALLRQRELQNKQPNLSAGALAQYEALMAASPEDPSSMTAGDVQYYLDAYGQPTDSVPTADTVDQGPAAPPNSVGASYPAPVEATPSAPQTPMLDNTYSTGPA